MARRGLARGTPRLPLTSVPHRFHHKLLHATFTALNASARESAQADVSFVTGPSEQRVPNSLPSVHWTLGQTFSLIYDRFALPDRGATAPDEREWVPVPDWKSLRCGLPSARIAFTHAAWGSFVIASRTRWATLKPTEKRIAASRQNCVSSWLAPAPSARTRISPSRARLIR